MTTQSWISIEEFASQSLGQTQHLIRQTANRRFGFRREFESLVVAESVCSSTADVEDDLLKRGTR